jgi:hypothetical protein
MAVKGAYGPIAQADGYKLVSQFYSWYVGTSYGYWELFIIVGDLGTCNDIKRKISEARDFYEIHQDKSTEKIIQILNHPNSSSEDDISSLD